jgi:hypothetical protein
VRQDHFDSLNLLAVSPFNLLMRDTGDNNSRSLGASVGNPIDDNEDEGPAIPGNGAIGREEKFANLQAK